MRTRQSLSVLFSALLPLILNAQHNPYDYYLGGSTVNYFESDNHYSYLSLFDAPLESGGDIFSRISGFNFSAVSYSRRGFDLPVEKVYLGNIRISDGLTANPDYALLSTLRRSKIQKLSTGGIASTDAPGAIGEVELFNPDPSLMPAGYSAGISTFTRNGKIGMNFSAAKQYNSKLFTAASLVIRNGRDSKAKGVFNEEASIALLGGYKFRNSHKLTLGIFASASRRGLRASSTMEAFELTGDNLYNPVWGYSDGKVRNSRVRTERPFMIYAAHKGSFGKTKFEISMAYRDNSRAYGTLAWYDTPTPYPDYYSSMPSYIGNTPVGQQLMEMWRQRDPDVVQIDWNNIYEVNSFAGQMPLGEGGARYILEERIENPAAIQAVAAFNTDIDARSKISYGIRAGSQRIHFYKKAKDLLGAAPFPDVDQYLADTTTYGGKWLNNLREPNKLVSEGMRFGYDYFFRMHNAELFGTYNYTGNKISLAASAELGVSTIFREGLYEKELSPGDGSFGKSAKTKFDTYSAKLSAGYSFSPRHIFRLSATSGAKTPQPGNMFLSAEYSNRHTDRPEAIQLLAAEAEYMVTVNAFRCKFSAYYAGTSRESVIYSYYDDIEAVYSDMVVSGISKKFYGVEFGAQYDISARLRLTLAAAAGDFRYSSDPRVDIYADATLEQYVMNSETRLSGYRIGDTPSSVVGVELEYNMFGFITSLSVNYMAGRYVTPNPLRRMERTYNLADSPERRSQFVSQEKLPDAATVDLFILKSFALKQGYFTLIMSVNNLLNNKNIIYSGYEQMRIMRRGNGVNRHYEPFPSKYLYSYPRSFYLSATYKF